MKISNLCSSTDTYLCFPLLSFKLLPYTSLLPFTLPPSLVPPCFPPGPSPLYSLTSRWGPLSYNTPPLPIPISTHPAFLLAPLHCTLGHPDGDLLCRLLPLGVLPSHTDGHRGVRAQVIVRVPIFISTPNVSFLIG